MTGSKALFTTPRSRIAFAVDASSTAEATPLLDLLAPHVSIDKIGLELFTREGPRAVSWARERGLDVFLDLKLHDIPETVERAIAAISAMGVRYATIHAQGGPAMLERAARRAETEGGTFTLLAVTVLTSLDAADLAAVGVAGSPADQVLRLASLAFRSGVGGIVSSAAEAAALRAALGDDALLVTPGIRLPGTAAGDQKRVMGPGDARRAGADVLVVGRPLRDAVDPVRAARAIADDLAAAGDA